MARWGTAGLELLRICLLLAVALYVLDGAERYLLRDMPGQPAAHLLRGLGNFLFFFVLYRNRLQFRGWHSSPRNKRLTLPVTAVMVMAAIALILVPTFL
ncbi:hypothetical protein [Paenibacillus sp. R14(2021)]|uniref:hypothetical protein n=1 Tax=Paenibacillus sp. R14(2021) TaxID=2859228 RepID=UPI001C6121FA|nr:hypothetical protein [Paenibacillus sp. R14(2021)]